MCKAQIISLILLENILLVLSFCLYFNVIRVTLITGLYRRLTKENLEKHGFLRPQNMSLTENSNRVFLPGVGEHGSFLYAISKVIICNLYEM